jgi:hypothetical protein
VAIADRLELCVTRDSHNEGVRATERIPYADVVAFCDAGHGRMTARPDADPLPLRRLA